MIPEIQLESRYGIDNRLVLIKGETLKFKLKSEFNFRIGFEDSEKNECTFIDPSGGPLIRAGSVIKGHVVKAVYKDGTVEFES